MKLASRDVIVIMIIITILKLSMNIGTAPSGAGNDPGEKIAALGRSVYEVCGRLELIREVHS